LIDPEFAGIDKTKKWVYTNALEPGKGLKTKYEVGGDVGMKEGYR
jgi:hypothetical protein